VLGPRARFVATLAGITIIALLVRIAFHVAYSPAQLPFSDGLWYHTQANFFVDGHGFIDPFAYAFRGQTLQSAGHPPLFVFALAAVSFLGGTSVVAHQLTEIALDTLAVATIGLVAREVAGDRAGVIAACIAAVYPRLWATEGEVLSESLYAVTIASMLLAAYRFWRSPSLGRALVLGLTVGLAALCRGEGLLFLPMLVLPVVELVPRVQARRPALLLAAAVGALVVLSPWTIYNATRFKEPVLISTSLGWVVSGANCDATFHGKGLGLWDIQCSARPVTGDESQQSGQVRRLGTSYALDHIGHLPVVMAARVGRVLELFHPDPFTFGPSWVRLLMLGAWYGLIPVAIAGTVVLRRRRVTLLPLVATVAAVMTSVALTWGSLRFRVPVDVTFIVLAAIALDAAIGGSPQRRVSLEATNVARCPTAPSGR
jgi:4-amino-4-deoxy-L-arabinose transferase-like glycosyltransferase